MIVVLRLGCVVMLGFGLCFGLFGCGPQEKGDADADIEKRKAEQEEKAENNTSSRKKRDEDSEVGVKDAVDYMTGKTQTDQLKKTQKKVDDINKDRQKQYEELGLDE
jgi:uncharacterized protein HemX